MRLGWYIHHHGSGHGRRFEAVRPRLTDVTALTSLAPPASRPDDRWLTLPMDAPAPAGDDPGAGGALHWAPRHHAGLRSRMAAIATWIDSAQPDAIVCDVSVEVAALCRLMGVPVVWLAQRGVRTDAPHQLAYGLSRVVAPWTTETGGAASTGLPGDTRFIGALSRFDGRSPTSPPRGRRVLVLLGAGGHSLPAAAIAAAARATPEWSWTVAGLGKPVEAPVTDADRRADVWSLLAETDVVVASAGQNVVSEIAAARRPLVCIPQSRPFDEQHDHARQLARAGLADSLPAWPRPGEWAAVLERAVQRDPARWSMLHDGRAALRLVEVIREVACGSA